MSRWTVEPLSPRHDVEPFDCGVEPLNRYLVRFALANQKAEAARTYVLRDLAAEGAVAGYHTLVAGEVAHADAAGRLSKGLARHPVPVIVLARLAVARDLQGCGLGAALLKDALLRAVAAADIAGVRAFLIHAKDESARAFYLRYGFEPSPTDPMHLYRLIRDIRRDLAG